MNSNTQQTPAPIPIASPTQAPSSIINPATGRGFTPVAGEFFVEVETVEIYNAGGKYSSDQVVFKCPFCRRRNRQSIREAKAMTERNVAAFRCMCRRLVYVRKPAVAKSQSVIISPYTK